MKILCVDDAEVVRNDIRHEVTRLDHDYFAAQNASEAYDIIKSETPDLIFLDLNMPGKSGLELLEQLGEENLKFGYVIMLTTEGSMELKAKGKKLGVKAWIVKPLKRGMFDQILAKVASAPPSV